MLWILKLKGYSKGLGGVDAVTGLCVEPEYGSTCLHVQPCDKIATKHSRDAKPKGIDSARGTALSVYVVYVYP